MESTNDGTVHQMHIKYLAGYEPSLPITYYKKLKKENFTIVHSLGDLLKKNSPIMIPQKK